MANKNARVIIPLAIGVWVLGILAFAAGLPSALATALTVVLVLVMALGVPAIVFYLIAETGWNQLKRQYRAREPFVGTWTTVPTGQMALVSVHSDEFKRSKGRFTGTLRIGLADEALYLSTLFTRLPVIGLFFPTVAVPWREVVRARKYEAPGWVSARSAGAVAATYDPNYTGEFVELEIGEPRVFIQLPLGILGDHAAGLPFES